MDAGKGVATQRAAAAAPGLDSPAARSKFFCRCPAQTARGKRKTMFSETTDNITVTVRPVFIEEQSSPAQDKYVWAYKVRIENRGTETVQLLNRHWRITDARGKLEEVKGPGVVGEQPVLKPGEAFEYTSGCPLKTPSGFMVGTYEMERLDGTRFQVRIPMFSLDSPHAARRIH